MACGNTHVSRHTLRSQPTTIRHPSPPPGGWPQITDKTMWLNYSYEKNSDKVDLYLDNRGGMNPVEPSVDSAASGVDRSDVKGTQQRFRHDPYVELAQKIVGVKAHAHLTGRVLGDDPR